MTHRRRMRWSLLFATLTIALGGLSPLAASRGTAQEPQVVVPDLKPTVHLPLPATLDGYWLVPPDGYRLGGPDVVHAVQDLAQAGDLIGTKKAAQALGAIRLGVLKPTPLFHYGLYKKGMAELALERFDQARATFRDLRALAPPGYLSEASALREAEASEGLKAFAAAVAAYESVITHKLAVPESVTLQLARAAHSAGDAPRELKYFEQVYYEWPTTSAGDAAAKALVSLRRAPLAARTDRFTRELARAERLYAARRYVPSRANFDLVRPAATGATLDHVRLRIAECDYYLKRYQRSRDALAPLLKTLPGDPEARYYWTVSIKGLGANEDYVRQVRRMVELFPASPWTDDALDGLASHWIVVNEDDKADEAFRDVIARFPHGRHADRARWKSGWWAYRHARYQDAAALFDAGAVSVPRSDYRPSFLYWAGKAHEKLGAIESSNVRFLVAVTDYANSYYGRLSVAALKTRNVSLASPAEAARRLAPPPGSATRTTPEPALTLVRWLIAAEMYDEALDEVQYLERTLGSSPELRATRAWLLNRRGDTRPAISVMRAAYPQMLAAGGESMPDAIQKILYPLEYLPLIQKYAGEHGLDPYVMAALILQESAFDPNARSAANAIGLMQVVPSTARRYARILGMRTFTVKQLTTPEVNIRIGMAVFADLVQRFGDVHLALCGYNAGDARAAQWMAERQALPLDEWIDDIPFPETQTYVRRILGIAEDYRRLYGK